MKWIEVTFPFADKSSVKTKRGSTGLTQKEAIFRIFKNVLGSKLATGMNVRELICTRPNDYGRALWDSSLLNRITQEIYQGLVDGSIPSKLNFNKEGYSENYFDQLRRQYSNRIAHYWMKHDKRLNGGKTATRKSPKQKAMRSQIIIEDRIANDAQLIALQELKKTLTSAAEISEVEGYATGRIFTIILNVVGADSAMIPEDLKKRFKLYIESAEGEKKAA